MKIPQRINFTHKDESIVHPPRRSPRLLNRYHTPKDPQTAIPKCDNNGIHPKTPLLSVEKPSWKKALNRCEQRSSQLCKESEIQATDSQRSNTGLCLRRSPRFSTHLDNQALGDRRKSNICSSRGIKWNGQEAWSNMVKAGENICSYKIEKRLTRSSSKKKGDESTRVVCEGTYLASLADRVIDERKKKLDDENKRKGKCSASLADVERGQMMDKGSNPVRKTIGVKRKRNEVKESNGVNELWTNDQEQALQKAYFAMKPTPHFWKKVAKLVVGKSAQDCFDKVQADHLSPLPRPKRHLTINASKPSLLSISTSNFPSPVEIKKKQSKIRKNNAQKAVRKLLQQHCHENQENETDLFSVLEGSTVAHALKRDCIEELIPQALIFDESPVGGGSESAVVAAAAALVSPPVLKQVKNKALHEKYIDRLHQREAKRKTADTLLKKTGLKKKEEKSVVVQVLDSVKMAKDALVLGAQNVVKELKKLEGDKNDDDSIDSLDREEEDDEL